jgi:branched-chain amino acid transport system permease protein
MSAPADVAAQKVLNRPLMRVSAAVSRRWRSMGKGWRIAAGLAGALFLYTLPMWDPPLLSTPGSDFGGVLFSVATFVLVAVGLNVVVGQAGLLDLGYIGFYAVGAYSVALWGSFHASLPWVLLLPLAMICAMGAGVVLGTPTLRLRGDYLAIVTLGFGEIIRLTAVNLDWMGGAAGITKVPRPPSVGPITFGVLDQTPYYWLALTMIFIVVFFLRRLERSRVGRAWMAIREDEDAAELMGVPTFTFKLWAFAIGAAVGGISGALFAGRQGFVSPESFPVLTSVLILAAVVLGGAGNLPGVILGAVVISYLPERFRGFAEWRFFIFGVALVVVMIFRPQGLLPSRRRALEVADAPRMHDDRLSLAGADLEVPLLSNVDPEERTDG